MKIARLAWLVCYQQWPTGFAATFQHFINKEGGDHFESMLVRPMVGLLLGIYLSLIFLIPWTCKQMVSIHHHLKEFSVALSIKQNNVGCSDAVVLQTQLGGAEIVAVSNQIINKHYIFSIQITLANYRCISHAYSNGYTVESVGWLSKPCSLSAHSLSHSLQFCCLSHDLLSQKISWVNPLIFW